MLIENRIRGILIWTLSLIYLVLFLVKLINDPSSLSMQVITLYTAINILIVLIGFYVVWQRYPVKMWLNSLIFVLGLILSTILIYYSDGIMGPYFPFLYLILLILTAFNRSKILLYLTSAIILFIVGIWVYISPIKVQYFVRLDYILYLVILFVTIIIIRNYPLECLSCDFVNEYCTEKECENCDMSNVKCPSLKSCSAANYNKNN